MARACGCAVSCPAAAYDAPLATFPGCKTLPGLSPRGGRGWTAPAALRRVHSASLFPLNLVKHLCLLHRASAVFGGGGGDIHIWYTARGKRPSGRGVGGRGVEARGSMLPGRSSTLDRQQPRVHGAKAHTPHVRAAHLCQSRAGARAQLLHKPLFGLCVSGSCAGRGTAAARTARRPRAWCTCATRATAPTRAGTTSSRCRTSRRSAPPGSGPPPPRAKPGHP